MTVTTKPIVHSHSSLDMHEKCPKQYHQVRILKRFPYVQGPEAKRGEQIHAALEELGNTGHIAPEFASMAWGFNALVADTPAVKHYEFEFNFNKEKIPVGPRDWANKHLTGSADVLMLMGDTAAVIDWKTGRADYPKPLQLERMAVFTMWQFPEVQRVVGMLVFLEHTQGSKGSPVVSVTYTRDKLGQYEAALGWAIAKVEQNVAQGVWLQKPSALCPWCPVQDCSAWVPPPVKEIK